MTTTIDQAVAQGDRAAAPGAGPCAPGEVTLSSTAITVGTAPTGFNAEVYGVAVDERYVYATLGSTGIQNGHDTAGPGELVIYEREALRVAVLAGTAPPARRVTVGRQPRSVASLVRPDYERVFVVNYHQDSYSVTVLDRKTWALVAETKTGQTPIDIAVHAGRGRAYLTDAYHGIRVLDARTGAELPDEHIDIDRELIGVAVDEASDTLFVAHSTQYFDPPNDQLVMVDLKTRAITQRVKFRAHSNPVDVAYDAAAGTVFVRTIGPVNDANQIGVLAVQRAAPTATPGVLVSTSGGRGVTVAAGPAGTRVYATASGRLDVFDPGTRERVASTTLAAGLGSVAVDRLTGEIYTGDLRDGRMFRLVPVVGNSPIGRHPLVADGTLGAALEAPRLAPDGEALMQRFQHGLAVASADFGAVAVRGTHQESWRGGTGVGNGRAARGASSRLGNPATDTMTVAGRQLTHFADGIIVTLDSGADVVVSGAIWKRYADGGDIAGGYGLPLAAEVPSAGGGGHQEFQHAVLFHRGTGDAATVIWRGPLWDGLLAQHGGTTGHLGFPAADLERSYQPDTGLPTAEWASFEGGALVWNATDNAVYWMLGEFWRDWQLEGGPDGHLGLPTSDPQVSPHDPTNGLWYVQFQLGVLVLFPQGHPLRPTHRDCQVARNLELKIMGFRTVDSDGVGGGGAADPYIDHWLAVRYGAGDPVFRWDGRLPGDAPYWEDVVDVPWEPLALQLAPVARGDLVVTFAMHCWDFDTFSDDKLGEIERDYTIDNLWGLKGEPEEHYSETDDGSFTAFYVMKPFDEPIDLSGNFRGRYFWQFMNPDTPRLSTEIFSRVYTDVEAGVQFSLDPRDWVREGWEAIWYHKVFKGIAKPGNCYGMSVEAVEALHGRSSFASPVYQHGHPRLGFDPNDDLYGTPDPANADDVDMMTRINVRHASQLGARVVEFVARLWMDTLRGGAIDDGQRVWAESKAAYDRGDWPVFAMMREWKKGSHTVLPYRWNEFYNGEKEIWLADPSKPPLLREPDDVTDGLERIFIFTNGTWRYDRFVNGGFSTVSSYYSEAPRWLVWVPMSCFSGQHTLPSAGMFLDVIVDGLVNWGFSTVVGGDVDTRQISDAAGRTLFRDGLDHLPSSPLDLRSDPGGFIPGLVPIPVFGGDDVPVDGEFFHAAGRHELLAHDLVPRHAGGSYHIAMRNGPMAVSVQAPTDAHPDRVQAENVGSGKRSVGFSRGKTLPPKTIQMMVDAFPAQGVPVGRVPAGDRNRQFLLEDLTVTGGQTVVARPADGGNELLVSTYGAPASFAVRMRGRAGTPLSRVRRITVEKDRTAVLRPAGWTTEALDAAPLPVEIRQSPDGPRIRCYEAPPEGPAEQ